MSTAAYINFTRALINACTEMGLAPLRSDTPSTLPENNGWCFLRFGHDQAAALIIPKSVLRMGNCHVHIDMQGTPGHIPLPKRNGRVICHYEPSLELIIKHLLPRLPGAEKRASLPPVSKTPVSTAMAAAPVVTVISVEASEPVAASVEEPVEQTALAKWLASEEPVELQS